jgi:hypothetical protein
MDDGQYRETTKEEDLPQAKQFAEDWYITVRGKARAGLLTKKREKTFQDAADIFTDEYETITQGARSKKWVEGDQIRCHHRRHLALLENRPLRSFASVRIERSVRSHAKNARADDHARRGVLTASQMLPGRSSPAAST